MRDFIRQGLGGQGGIGELEGKVPMFYSGKYQPHELPRPDFEALGRPTGPTPAADVAKLNSLPPNNGFTIHDTPIGKVLDQMEREQWYDARTRKALWRVASKQFANEAKERPASAGYVRNADPTRTYRQIELPDLKKNQDHIHPTDQPMTEKGTPTEWENIPAQFLDKDGRWIVM